MRLSILCVTRGDDAVLPFIDRMCRDALDLGAEILVCVDGEPTRVLLALVGSRQLHRVQSAGYIESVLDEAVAYCRGEYVLRLDDDERISPALLGWLNGEHYLGADHWAFPRANLWGDSGSVLVNPPLWPDLQTRLSIKPKAGGRYGVHDGSPFGTGRVAPAVIEHHKYLIKGRAEREAQAARYDALRAGAGTSDPFWPFMVPEAAFWDGLMVASLGNGDADAIENEDWLQVMP